jgi:hypothetical protein
MEPLLDAYRGFTLKHTWSAADSRWTTRAYYDGTTITLATHPDDPVKSTAKVCQTIDVIAHWADNERCYWEHRVLDRGRR